MRRTLGLRSRCRFLAAPRRSSWNSAKWRRANAALWFPRLVEVPLGQWLRVEGCGAFIHTPH
jgi:hypothetical protein